MAKIQLKSDNINPFGGLFSIFQQFDRSGLRQTIDSALGKRGTTKAAFSHGDVFASLFGSYLCGGDCIEDVMNIKPFWDGRDLRPDFGGRISAEIRLPQALQAGLLTPFQYLCISDDTDLSDDSLWSGQKYNIERLADKLCAKSRAKLIADALHKYLADEYTCRALCFCVNKRHADFMAEQLRLYGFNAESLTSDTPAEERKRLANSLREGTLHYLCVVDIFNEGVDIPEVDTVLFLRPTESLTIFLQQLGRGLRLSVGKTELTVLPIWS